MENVIGWFRLRGSLSKSVPSVRERAFFKELHKELDRPLTFMLIKRIKGNQSNAGAMQCLAGLFEVECSNTASGNRRTTSRSPSESQGDNSDEEEEKDRVERTVKPSGQLIVPNCRMVPPREYQSFTNATMISDDERAKRKRLKVGQDTDDSDTSTSAENDNPEDDLSDIPNWQQAVEFLKECEALSELARKLQAETPTVTTNATEDDKKKKRTRGSSP